jgi:hypothetical protein
MAGEKYKDRKLDKEGEGAGELGLAHIWQNCHEYEISSLCIANKNNITT